MKWLKEQGCTWGSTKTFHIAVVKGDLRNIKWLKENGCPWDAETFQKALKE